MSVRRDTDVPLFDADYRTARNSTCSPGPSLLTLVHRDSCQTIGKHPHLTLVRRATSLNSPATERTLAMTIITTDRHRGVHVALDLRHDYWMANMDPPTNSDAAAYRAAADALGIALRFALVGSPEQHEWTRSDDPSEWTVPVDERDRSDDESDDPIWCRQRDAWQALHDLVSRGIVTP